MENVTFAYEEREESALNKKEILHKVNLHFPKGSFISIVGTSGCGKSTIAGILMGRNRGYEGSIKIGGMELSEISEDSLMKNITMVTHDSYLFKGSVKDNLLMGKKDASVEEMENALKLVNLSDFINTQEGLDTLVLDKGSNFSGGQRQRLAIARALLHDTPIYIFDEATSNIDVESEEMIMEVIHNLGKSSKTVILISHRLANVVASDKIYMLSGGNIVESGNHAELMDKGRYYKNLYEQQKELESHSSFGHKENGEAVIESE